MSLSQWHTSTRTRCDDTRVVRARSGEMASVKKPCAHTHTHQHRYTHALALEQNYMYMKEHDGIWGICFSFLYFHSFLFSCCLHFICFRLLVCLWMCVILFKRGCTHCFLDIRRDCCSVDWFISWVFWYILFIYSGIRLFFFILLLLLFYCLYPLF